MKKIAILLLVLCLLSAFGACSKNGEAGDGTPTISEDASLISSHGWIREDEVMAQKEISEWYAEAADRKVVRNALIYARDSEDGLWHCWLYLGSWGEGDSLSFGADATDGYTVVISHMAYSEDDLENSTGAVYFTVACDAEPSFDLYVNNESEGMITTHADTSVKKIP